MSRPAWWVDSPGFTPSTNKHAAKRFQRLTDATPRWADRRAIEAIYREARRLTLRSRRGGKYRARFVVDHVIPLQGETVSGLHVHTNLRIVPSTVNARKYNFYDPLANP